MAGGGHMPDGKRRPVVKYALVPSGRDTCGWCYMLSSRGYFYGSEASAARSKHEGCKCVVWSSSQASEIEDYDPEWMKKCWRDCCETVDYESVHSNAEREWERMEEAERAEWRKLDKKTRARIESLPEDIRKKVGLDDASLDKGAFDNYCGKRWLDEACNEVGRRDVGWLHGEEGRRYPLYSRYNVVETVDTSRGRVEVIRYNQANNNKRPQMAGRPNAIYATRSKTGRVNNVYFTDADGIIIEEWNCGTHGHNIDGVRERWYKHIGIDHKTAIPARIDATDVEFWEELKRQWQSQS